VERLAQGGAIAIDADGKPVERLAATYAELPPGGAGALFGSTDHLEIAAPSASAADHLQLGRGAIVRLRRR
jgi:S-adenosylmethionine hydrolase